MAGVFAEGDMFGFATECYGIITIVARPAAQAHSTNKADYAIDSMIAASWNLWFDGGFLVLRLTKRGAASWQDGGK